MRKTRTHFKPEDKLKIVLEHIEEGTSFANLQKKYGADDSTIVKWHKMYKEFGTEGLIRKVQSNKIKGGRTSPFWSSQITKNFQTSTYSPPTLMYLYFKKYAKEQNKHLSTLIIELLLKETKQENYDSIKKELSKTFESEDEDVLIKYLNSYLKK